MGLNSERHWVIFHLIHRFSKEIKNGLVMITVIINGVCIECTAQYICCIISYMRASTFGLLSRGITQSDVSHAADTLLRAGERPTIEKIRAKIGRGSPNTVNPLLDAWWKTLSARLDSGPAALHRLPESVAHIAEALWMQALEEGKCRAVLEQGDNARVAELDKQRLEVRSHVISLREGELDARLRDRDRTIEELSLRCRELTGSLRKEQATLELLSKKAASFESALHPKRRPKKPTRSILKPKLKKEKKRKRLASNIAKLKRRKRR
jgi:uncharacterized coiled-coil protein SlyX